jgi:hypothetical protein
MASPNLAIQKKYNLQEPPIKITVKKKPEEMKDEKDTHYVAYLRQPDIADLDFLFELYSNKKFTATQTAITTLWLEGDMEFQTNKNLISSCVSIIGQFIEVRDVEFEKN